MADLVLVTGLGTGRRTAWRVAGVFGETMGVEARGFTYSEAERNTREFRRASHNARVAIGHSQGSEQVVRLVDCEQAVLIAPPIDRGTVATTLRLPHAFTELAGNPQSIPDIASGVGEMMLHGLFHSSTAIRGHVGRGFLRLLRATVTPDRSVLIVQMEGDRVIPVNSGAANIPDGIEHHVITGGHNRIITDPGGVARDVGAFVLPKFHSGSVAA